MADDRKYGTSRAAQIVIADRHKCFVCGGVVPDDTTNCPGCDFPQNGDESEQRYFLGRLRAKKIEVKRDEYSIGRAFQMLLPVPVCLLLLSLDYWKNEHAVLSAQITGLIGCTFLSIWIFGRRSPYRAFALSLALYALITIPLFIYAPKIILSTKFMIIAPYIYLPIGMHRFKAWKNLKKDLEGKNTG
jgi:hypothetical protein